MKTSKYNHEPGGYICPFCLLIAGVKNEHVQSIHSDIIYSNDDVTVLVSLHQWPNNHGNVIVVPNQHYENIYELPVSYAGEIHKAAKQIALAMKAIYGCDGVSTRQHNEPAGNQDVWHYHLHVTPRYDNDQFYTTHKELMAAEERATHAENLKKALIAVRG